MTKRDVQRIALVTGAARGIGAAVAIALARRGIVPILAARRPEAAASVLEEIRSLGIECDVHPCDVSNAQEVQALVATILGKRGRLDILVNNAGRIEPIGHIADTDSGEWANVISTNLLGPYYLMHAALPALVESQGVVLNLSSGAALTPREGWSAYCSSKAGLAMLTRCLVHEYGARGVRGYSFQPGFVDTGMQGSIRASGMNEVSRMPREKLAPPDLPAQVIAWLCDEKPEEFSGRELSINMEDLLQRARASN